MALGAQRFTPREFHDALARFGIGVPPRVGLPDEAEGTLRSLQNWNKYTHVSVAFGQEVTASVAQIARSFSAFARHGSDAGTVPSLRLSAVGVGGPDGLVARRAVSPEAALKTREVMVGIADKLDARLERTEGPFAYSMFGKSGTAQVVPERTEGWQRRPRGARGYLERQYVSSFVAGAPVERPRLVVMVSIEDPGPDVVRRNVYYGSQVAGPAVRRIMEQALPYLGVEPDRVSADASSTSAVANAR
jgi:cell division protein FtsI (penicillin-binding protein 3)